MRLKLLKQYGMLAAGSVMNVDTPVGELLIGRKIAIEIKEDKRGKYDRSKKLSTSR